MRKREETEEKYVNFLDFGKKKGDLRYQFHDTHFMENDQETIHWIGIIDLHEVGESTSEVAIAFLNKNHEAIIDYYEGREIDGSPTGSWYPYQYQIDHPALKVAMLAAKEKGAKFYHLPLEERVEGSGVHEVTLLYKEEEGEGILWGLASRVPLLKMALEETIFFAQCRVEKSTKRLRLMGHGRYRWQK